MGKWKQLTKVAGSYFEPVMRENPDNLAVMVKTGCSLCFR
jgi:hypothetical protein